jgi:hypothetical protein
MSRKIGHSQVRRKAEARKKADRDISITLGRPIFKTDKGFRHFLDHVAHVLPAK